MDIQKVLQSAATIKATEAMVKVGEPTILMVGGKPGTLFASTVEADAFEEGVIRRLDVFAREQLRTTGQYQWHFDVKGIGRIQADVEPDKARFLLPSPSETQTDATSSTRQADREEKSGGFLSKLFRTK
ncbi:MAG: hypothetical protein ABI790_08260 [Betaproteobacteria bacterium]